MKTPIKRSARRGGRAVERGRRYSIAEARNQLASLVHDCERGKPVELTRRGSPVAVLLSIEEYRRLTEGPDLMARIERFRASHDLEALDAEAAFAETRDRDPGRTFKW